MYLTLKDKFPVSGDFSAASLLRNDSNRKFILYFFLQPPPFIIKLFNTLFKFQFSLDSVLYKINLILEQIPGQARNDSTQNSTHHISYLIK